MSHIGPQPQTTHHVAAVIPAFNVGRVVGGVLEEIPYEIQTVIVVDDGSTDDTARVVERFAQCDPRNQLIRHERNCGVGAAMVRFVEAHLAAQGVRFFQVKTVGPSRPDEFYERTRRFYEVTGFTPLEEFPSLWPGNPCLLLVKALGGSS